ncbi:hypothetical protein [uncultured Roseobacter sp.]|uniref:hypothetical protein n=1 Tax=uncultured Roseobacter sp. TaxID=114847 RepID=UPI00262E31BD|nr:hypothetical protein [uncultured Roseobacter sp.]
MKNGRAGSRGSFGDMMKLNGYEVFSRQTTASWRILVTLSSTLIAIKYFDYNTEAWPVLNRDVKTDDFSTISSLVVLFLLVSYLVNWYGDYVGFTKWFKINSVAKNSLDDIGKAKNHEAPIEGVLRRLDALSRSNEVAADRVLDIEAISLEDLKAVQGDRNVAKDLETLRSTVASNSQTLGLLASSCSDLEGLLSDLEVNFSAISLLSKLLLYGWYLLVPVVFALSALLIS